MILTKKSKNEYRKPLKRVFTPKKVKQLIETKKEIITLTDERIGEVSIEKTVSYEGLKKKTKKKNNKE